MKTHSIAVARIVGVSLWLRLRAWMRAKLHRCLVCREVRTDEGIGGQCVKCGRIWRWPEVMAMPKPGDGTPRS